MECGYMRIWFWLLLLSIFFMCFNCFFLFDRFIFKWWKFFVFIVVFGKEGLVFYGCIGGIFVYCLGRGVILWELGWLGGGYMRICFWFWFFLVGCWKRDIVVLCNELVVVVELGLWLMLLIVFVVNSFSLRFEG